MGVSKKPRKKYKPKVAVRLDPMAYATESVTMLKDHGDYAVDHKLQVSSALANLVKGVGTIRDMTYVYAGYNVTLALTDMKSLQGAAPEVLLPALHAMDALAARYRESQRYTLKAPEIRALQDMVDFHHELMEVITVVEMEQAIMRARGHILNKTTSAALKYMVNEAGA